MSCRVFIRPAAEADVRESRDWYQRQRPGLGDEFLLAVADGWRVNMPLLSGSNEIPNKKDQKAERQRANEPHHCPHEIVAECRTSKRIALRLPRILQRRFLLGHLRPRIFAKMYTANAISIAAARRATQITCLEPSRTTRSDKQGQQSLRPIG